MNTQCWHLGFASSLLSLIACGRGAAEVDRNHKSNKPTTMSYLSVEAEEGAISSQIDESIASIAADDDTAVETAFGLAPQGGVVERSYTRACEEDEANQSAIVTIQREFSRSFSTERAIRSFSMEVEHKGSQVRTWSQEGKTVACGPEKKFALIDPNQMDGVKLGIEFSRSHARSLTVKTRSGETTKSSSYSATGKREIRFSNPSAPAPTGKLVRIKTVTSTANRSFRWVKADGTEVEATSTVATLAESPLVVEVTRDATTHAITSRLVKSGTVVAKRKDGITIETTFANVKFTRDGRCMPESGSISGRLYSETSENSERTFTITFSGNEASLTDGEGNSLAFDPEGCAFDVDEVK